MVDNSKNRELFKYLPSVRIDVLENLKIRMSPLKSLNDPFESILPIDFGEARSFGKLYLNQLIKKSGELRVFHSENELNQMAKVFSQSFEKAFQERTSPTTLVDAIGDKWGILSLSRNYDNLLMWSHYSHNASGYVIGFNRDHSFFNRLSKKGNWIRPVPVNYTNTKPVIKPILTYANGGVIKLSEYDKNLLLSSKANDWSYEQEERLMFNLEFSGSEEFDHQGQRIYLEPLPPEAITKVILGSQVSVDARQKIIKAIKKHSLRCEILQAHLSLNSFKLDFESIRI